MTKPNIIKIKAHNRTEFGKGAARHARVADSIPVIIYGADLDVPKYILVDTPDLHAVIRNHGVNAVLDINIEGESQLSIVKAVDQSPLTFDIDHADLLAIHCDEKAEIEVPVVPTGELTPGVLLMQDVETTLVNAPIPAIPEGIEVSVEGAEVGTVVHAGDVTLPEGLVLTDSADLLAFNIAEPEEEPADDVDTDIEGMGEAETLGEPAEEEAEWFTPCMPG